MTRRRRSDHSLALLAYTAAEIFLGVATFLWAIATFPVADHIDLTDAGNGLGVLVGLTFWIVIGLLGSTRIERLRGHGVLTFHIPFIVGAMALGGPVAGALVALISTIERREFVEAPWYGVLANHAVLTTAAIAGAVALLAVRQVLGATPVDPQAVELVAIIVGSVVLTVVCSALVAGTMVLRDRLSMREAFSVYDASYRVTAASEVVLGWLLAFTYLTVGWWAALIVTTLVLVVWQGHDAREMSRHDEMTGLLTRSSFDVHLNDAIRACERRGQRSALLAIDLDRFKEVNDRHGHDAGDAVLRTVGSRLLGSIRLTDAAVRRGGDEFGVLLADVADPDTASELALRIHDRLCEPIDIDDGVVEIGASVGLFYFEPSGLAPSAGRLHDLADGLMYEAKRAGEALRMGRIDEPSVPG